MCESESIEKLKVVMTTSHPDALELFKAVLGASGNPDQLEKDEDGNFFFTWEGEGMSAINVWLALFERSEREWFENLPHDGPYCQMCGRP